MLLRIVEVFLSKNRTFSPVLLLAGKKKLLVGGFLLSTAFQAVGQPYARTGLNGGVDAGIAVKKGYVIPSLMYFELISLAQSRSVYIGWTARLSSFYGNDLDYHTAPARLTRGTSGLGSLVKPLLRQNIDTVSFSHVAQTSFNLGVRAEWSVGRFELGASVDLVGFNLFRKSRSGLVRSSTGLFRATDSLGRTSQKPFRGADAYQSATPRLVNVRLLGDNDVGLLTTEVHVRFRLSRGLSLKAGYQWVSTEMVLSNSDIIAGNDRFRNRVGLLHFGLTAPITPW